MDKVILTKGELADLSAQGGEAALLAVVCNCGGVFVQGEVFPASAIEEWYADSGFETSAGCPYCGQYHGKMRLFAATFVVREAASCGWPKSFE